MLDYTPVPGGGSGGGSPEEEVTVKAVMMMGIGAVAVLAGCGRNPCSQFARAVCGQAPNTPACDRASRTTNRDECEGLLKDVARFIALANEKVETPVLQPPAPARPPAAPGGPDAQATAPEPPAAPAGPDAQAAEPPTAATPTQGAVESPPVPSTPTTRPSP